jgi:hypothetical protein
MILRYPGLWEQLYMGSTCTLGMTRKNEMRKGFVARTIHIPQELDDRLKLKAIKDRVRFSDVATQALEKYLK